MRFIDSWDYTNNTKGICRWWQTIRGFSAWYLGIYNQ